MEGTSIHIPVQLRLYTVDSILHPITPVLDHFNFIENNGVTLGNGVEDQFLCLSVSSVQSSSKMLYVARQSSKFWVIPSAALQHQKRTILSIGTTRGSYKEERMIQIETRSEHS